MIIHWGSAAGFRVKTLGWRAVPQCHVDVWVRYWPSNLPHSDRWRLLNKSHFRHLLLPFSTGDSGLVYYTCFLLCNLISREDDHFTITINLTISSAAACKPGALHLVISILICVGAGSAARRRLSDRRVLSCLCAAVCTVEHADIDLDPLPALPG